MKRTARRLFNAKYSSILLERIRNDRYTPQHHLGEPVQWELTRVFTFTQLSEASNQVISPPASFRRFDGYQRYDRELDHKKALRQQSMVLTMPITDWSARRTRCSFASPDPVIAAIITGELTFSKGGRASRTRSTPRVWIRTSESGYCKRI